MKSKEDKTAAPENAEHFTEYLGNIGFGNVHDGVEGHDGGPRAVSDVECQHVSLTKFDGRTQFAGLLEHARREIDAEDVHAAVAQVARHVARTTAEFADAASTFDTSGEVVENHAVHRLVFEFARDSCGVFLGDAVVAGLTVRKFPRIHGHP